MGTCEAEAVMETDDVRLGSRLSSPSPGAVGTPSKELEDLSLKEAEEEEEEEEEEKDAVQKGSSVPSAKEEEWEKGSQYPQRPGEPNCAYYMKTGCCGYGAHCKFNHPPERWNQASCWDQSEPIKVIKEKAYVILPETIGPPECKFYLMPGGCKYGKACRYGHYREKTDVESVKLNFLGLPIRLGEKECPYYMRTGICRYSTNCWFHHPEPIVEASGNTSSCWQHGGSPKHITEPAYLPETSWSLQGTSNEPVPCLNASSPSFVPRLFLPHQLLRSNPEYNRSQAPETPTTPLDRNMQSSSDSTFIDATTKTPGPVNQVSEIKEYTERLGEPECQFFLKYGDCKFKSSCKFHHPKTRLSKQPNCPLTPLGLPLRPDQPICRFYSHVGICKYGPACKFDHPMDSGSSISSKSSQNLSPDIRRHEIKMAGSNALVQQSVS